MKTILPILFFLFGCTVFGQKTIQKSTLSADNTQIWQEVEPFKNGFARVLKNDQFSFINVKNKCISNLFYSGARNFSNHFAAVQQNEKWGFINEIGQIIVPCEFDLVYDFNSKFTIALKDSNWYKINTQGETIKQLNIDICFGFENEMPIVSKNGQIGVLNSNDDFIFRKKITVPAPFYTLKQNNTASRTTSDCPNNLDFENGNFTSWSCFIGTVDTVGTVNQITVTPSAPLTNRHKIIRRTNPSAIDPFGLFSINPPDGSNFAVKLGNTNIGAQAERISYKIRVPQNDSNFSIKYNYAVVFEDPNHTSWSQPRFVARLFDSAANAYVSCASFEYISTSSLPGFARSTVDTAVIYKPWSSVFISLRAYAGKTMYIEFTTADCVRRGHWGYAYLDVESTCGESLNVNYNCNYPNITVLDAPPGFQTYNWWNQGFSNILANGEHAVLNPGPPSASTLWLEMIPFNNFGCRDTVKVNISGEFSPTFHSSSNAAPCAPHTFTFFNDNLPATQVIWNFGDGTTGTGDTVNHTYLTAGNYQVSMSVTLANGCVGTTTGNVIVNQPIGSLNYTGGNFCGNQTITFNVNALNATSYTWEFGDGSTVTTAQSSINHTYSSEGHFIPKVTIHFSTGCELVLTGSDSISIDNINADFEYTVAQFCGYTTLHFTSNSTSTSGIASYSWNFGNGNIGNGLSETQTYSTSGARDIKLIVTSLNGCVDSINKLIRINVWNYPTGNINGPNNGCAGDTFTFNHNFNALDSITQLEWFTDEGLSSSSNQPNFVFNTPGTHWVSLVVVNNHGCSDTLTKSILINSIPTFTQPQNISVCNGSVSSAIALASLYPGGNFTWSNDNTSIGLANTGSLNIPSFTAINSTNTIVHANITLSVVAQGCSYTAPSFMIAVQPTPQVNQPSNQTICNGSLTSAVVFSNTLNPNTTYFWQNNTPSIGLAASGNGNIAAFTATNTSSASINANIVVTPQLNGCDGTPKTFNILVNPTPVVSSISNQTVCNGTQINAIQFAVSPSNAVINWTNTQPSIGLLANGTGNIAAFQATNTTGSSITADITATPSFQGCVGNTQNFTILVNPTPQVNQPSNQTVCNGSLTSAVVFSNATNPNTSYFWQNNTPSIGLAASGNGNIAAFTATNTSSASINSNITVTPQFNGCSGLPKTFNILVNPTPLVSSISNQTVCNGTQINAIQFAVSPSNAVINWTNTQPSIGLLANGTGNIAAFQATNTTGSSITADITVTPNFQGCVGNTQNFTIQVNPTPTVNQPSNQTVCNGSLTSAVVFSNISNPNTTYIWQNNTPSIGLAASGNGNIAAFTATNTSNASINANIVVTPQLNGCDGTPKTFNILVNPTPVVSSISNQTVCNGTQINAIQFAVSPSNAVINWTNTQPSIGLLANGTGNIAAFQATNTTGSSITADITVTPNFQGCAGNTQNFTIQVNPTPSVIQPANQQVCFGASTSLIDFNSGISGTTFNWINNNSNIGLPMTGSGNISSFIPTNNNAFSDTAFITIMPVLNGCNGLPKSFYIAVSPNFNFTAPSNQTYCNGQNVSLINFNSTAIGSSINWINNNASIGLPSSGTGNILPFVATNAGNVIANANIIVTATYLNCPAITRSFNIQVNPSLTFQQPANLEVCPGQTINQIQFIGNVSGASYTWSNTNTNIGLAASGVGNIASFTAINNSSVIVNAQITVIGVSNGCTPVQRIFSINVNPSPVINNILDVVVCHGKITDTIFLTGPNAGTQYTWTNSNPTIGLAPRGSGHIMPFLATNHTSETQSGLIEIHGETPAHCSALVKVFKIFVNPIPRLATNNDINVCRGSNASLSVSGANSYSWTPANGLSCSNCSNPVVTASTSTTYFIVGTNASGCRSVDSIKVNVTQPFDMIVSPNDTVCAGRSIQLNANRATRYVWSPSTGLNNPNIANPIATPSISTTYTVVGYDAMGCFTDTASVYLMIGQNPSVNVGPDISAQTGSVITLNSTVQSGTSVSYNWSPSNQLSCNNCPNPSLTITGNQMLTLTVQNKYGCTAVDSLYIVTFCKDAQVFVANAFTPDGDNINDMLIVRGTGISVKSFRVFNRWGNVVFEKQHFQPNDPKYGWNGKVNGVPATPDVYVYIAEVTCDNGTVYFHKGNTTILK